MDNKLIDIFTRFSIEYKEWASDSVTRHNHMNDLEWVENIPQEKIDKVIDDFVARVQDIQEVSIVTAIDFLNFLTEQAKQENREKESDALLVDLINYIAMKYCIDYALYTVHLKKEAN